MSRDIVVGDLHIRKEEPFFRAAKSFLGWLLEYSKPEDNIIFLGDTFHTSKPFPVENRLFLNYVLLFINKGVNIIIVAGNHDWNDNQESHSINILDELVSTIYEPEFLETKNHSYFILPHLPGVDIEKFINSEKFIEDYKDFITKSKAFLYHYNDETVMFNTKFSGVDFSIVEKINPNIERIGGHVHLNSYPNYLGTPYHTTIDEANQKSKVYVIEKEVKSKIELPDFILYKEIEYNTSLDDLDKSRDILTIKNAPSTDLVNKKFKGFNIRSIELENLVNIDEIASAEDTIKSDIGSIFLSFVEEKKVDSSVEKYIKDKLFNLG